MPEIRFQSEKQERVMLKATKNFKATIATKNHYKTARVKMFETDKRQKGIV